MKPAHLYALLLALTLAGTPALAQRSVSGTIGAAPGAPAPGAAATPVVPPPAMPAPVAPRPAPAMTLAAPAPTATGSLLQTILALGFVLALLVAAAWFLKRYGPKAVTGGAHVRLVGALSVGARERILVIEVGGQWIVVGASPGRMNALATLPRQAADETARDDGAAPLPGANFAEWFKQTIEKRNGK